MPKATVYNMKAEKVGEIELSDAVFGVAPNKEAMHTLVVNYLANRKAGYTEYQNPYGSTRRRQKALETEGYRPCKTGQHPCAAVDGRRRSAGAEAQELPLYCKQKAAPAGV